ncbi:FtsK/SpoIIIE domain-containing protein, partial [Microbacterium sp.]|uniref:FtsK/SpoIIIE domain-containing protein n=1 Tax=Microbacterium sp. TaxID=51671 RepID=UPI003735EACA
MTATPLSATDEPVTLPRASTPAPRPPIPLLSALVPMVGAGVLWVVTGSAYALLFTLLGPLIVVASMADAARGSRRTRRRERSENARALAQARGEIDRRHDAERSERWARHPDVGGYLRRPETIWRTVTDRDENLVVGSGEVLSTLRIGGGEGDPAAGEVRRDASRIDRAPVVVPLTAGVAVVGPPDLAAAVVRALALQVCLARPPGRVRIGEDGPAWADAAPHRDAPAGLLMQVRERGGLVGADVDIPIVAVADGDPPPPRCGAVLRLTGPATARLDLDGRSHDVAVEPVAVSQAEALAAMLADRAERALGQSLDAAPPLQRLWETAPPGAAASLPAVFASAAAEPLAVDLVADGPHAVVIGVTGAGKSELLTSWVVSLCATHTPQQVAFLLVDFKGGRTFDHLLPLPHVTGVLTDLDDQTALRAIESLRAEVRHRERQLADLGARDVAEAGDSVGRLVIVVDEYAALVAAHPGLHELFADLAARGRALGIHLILAAQRATGVFRDAVLANAPLRIALRVTDAADSRTVLGVDDAAKLSGRPHARGVALVRRAGDTAPVPVRVARCEPGILDGVVARTSASPARRPWLPPLPAVVDLAGLRQSGEVILGMGDDPERQWQGAVSWAETDIALAVVGAAGSGRTAVLDAIAAQTTAVRIPSDPEAAWDMVHTLSGTPRGCTVLLDDLDTLLTRLPSEYAAAALDSLEEVVRGGRERGVRLVVSAQRLTGGLGRLVELMPRRVLLALATRADHVAAGGEAADHIADQPPGRGRLGRMLVQFALTDAGASPPPAAPPP